MAHGEYPARLTQHGSTISTVDIDKLMAAPDVSYWLKDTLRAALKRDCVDAWADAAVLGRVLEERMNAIQNHHTR